jgi:uncharacterized protein (DUF362 family)
VNKLDEYGLKLEKLLMFGYPPIGRPWIYHYSKIKPPFTFYFWIAFDKLTKASFLKKFKEEMLIVGKKMSRSTVKMGSIVSLVRVQSSVEDIRNSIPRALDLIDFKLNSSVKSAAIKPNLCYYWDSDTGYTTDPRVVAGIIDYVRERWGKDVDIKVVEADASAMRTKYAFPVLGYEKLAKEKNVELFNLSDDVLVEKTVHVNKREISFKVPELLLKADLFVNVPKLKIMRATKITCAMKNIFGCMGYRRKVVYHPFLEEAIVGINKILRPHVTVVDGLVALGRFPVKLGLIMAGADPFSVDWVASQIMGYEPSGVGFLKIAMREKFGNPNGITTCGENVAEYKRVFPRENFISSKYLWGIQFWLLKAYQKVTGDIIPPVLEDA